MSAVSTKNRPVDRVAVRTPRSRMVDPSSTRVITSEPTPVRTICTFDCSGTWLTLDLGAPVTTWVDPNTVIAPVARGLKKAYPWLSSPDLATILSGKFQRNGSLDHDGHYRINADNAALYASSNVEPKTISGQDSYKHVYPSTLRLDEKIYRMLDAEPGLSAEVIAMRLSARYVSVPMDEEQISRQLFKCLQTYRRTFYSRRYAAIADECDEAEGIGTRRMAYVPDPPIDCTPVQQDPDRPVGIKIKKLRPLPRTVPIEPINSRSPEVVVTWIADALKDGNEGVYPEELRGVVAAQFPSMVFRVEDINAYIQRACGMDPQLASARQAALEKRKAEERAIAKQRAATTKQGVATVVVPTTVEIAPQPPVQAQPTALSLVIKIRGRESGAMIAEFLNQHITASSEAIAIYLNEKLGLPPDQQLSKFDIPRLVSKYVPQELRERRKKELSAGKLTPLILAYVDTPEHLAASREDIADYLNRTLGLTGDQRAKPKSASVLFCRFASKELKERRRKAIEARDQKQFVDAAEKKT